MIQRQLVAALEIDTSMYSKIERGDRRIKRGQVPLIAKDLKDIPEELFMLWLADQDIAVVENDK